MKLYSNFILHFHFIIKVSFNRFIDYNYKMYDIQHNYNTVHNLFKEFWPPRTYQNIVLLLTYHPSFFLWAMRIAMNVNSAMHGSATYMYILFNIRNNFFGAWEMWPHKNPITTWKYVVDRPIGSFRMISELNEHHSKLASVLFDVMAMTHLRNKKYFASLGIITLSDFIYLCGRTLLGRWKPCSVHIICPYNFTNKVR